MVSRLFPIANNMYYSSDYTNYKSQTTLYKSIKQNRYNKHKISNFTLDSSSNCIVASDSYTNLLNITKGKYKCTNLHTSKKYNESTIGNILNVDMSNIVALKELNWDVSNNILNDGSNNMMIFPPPKQLYKNNWNTNAYPGFILDPSNELLLNDCRLNQRYKIYSLNKLGTLTDLSSNLYDRFENTKKINGIHYPNKVNLTN